MELFHTSPTKINKINKDGMFRDCLCFSSNIYSMGKVNFIYSVNIDESDIIKSSQLFYHDDYKKLDNLLSDIQNIADCDKETAEDYLSGNLNNEDVEIDWEIQGIMGKAAEILGYKAASVQDEQGECYMIPLFKKENMLQQEEG